MGELSTGFIIAGILAIVGGPTSAAWIGVKLGLNGVRHDISAIQLDIKEIEVHRETDIEARHQIDLKVAALETRWDGIDRRAG